MVSCNAINILQQSQHTTTDSDKKVEPITPPADSPAGNSSQTVKIPSQPNQVIINNTQTNTSTSSQVIIKPDLDSKYAINPNILSFNTGYFFVSPLEQDADVQKFTQNLRPVTLRFPGGTIGNYYHPDGPGYGLRQSDVKGGFPEITKAMPLFQDNAIYHFAQLCKMGNSNAVYVANLMTGTVEETIWAVQYLLSQNIQIKGIELGNEFYLNQYRSVFPTVQSYIAKAKEFAIVLKKKFPNISLGVVAANPTGAQPKDSFGKFQNQWNSALGRETFYDFYIPHLYSNVQACFKKGGSLKEIFNCANILLAVEHFDYFKIILAHYEQFYGKKPMYITEWNVEAVNEFSNTIRQAEFVGESILNLIATSAQNPELSYSFFHNYGSGGYVSPLFTYTTDSKNKYLKKEGNVAYNAAYFPFSYLRDFLDLKLKGLNEQISYPNGLNNQSVVFKTFISPDSKKLYLFFINKTQNNIAFSIPGAKNILQIKGIRGDYPWSVAGKNGLHKTYPKDVNLIQYINENKAPNDYSVPANSVGYLVIALS